MNKRLLLFPLIVLVILIIGAIGIRLGKPAPSAPTYTPMLSESQRQQCLLDSASIYEPCKLLLTFNSQTVVKSSIAETQTYIEKLLAGEGITELAVLYATEASIPQALITTEPQKEELTGQNLKSALPNEIVSYQRIKRPQEPPSD